MVTRFIAAAIFAGLVALTSTPAWPQSAPSQTPTAVQVPAPQSGPIAIPPQAAERALTVLTDDAKRAQLIDTLRTIAKASTMAPAEPASPAAHARPVGLTPSQAAPVPGQQAATLPPDSLGAQLVLESATWAKDLSEELVGIARSLTDLPVVWHGVAQFLSDEGARADALDAGWRLAVVLLLALIAEGLVRRLMQRPLSALEGEADARGVDLPPLPEAGSALSGAGAAEPFAARDAATWSIAQRLPQALLRFMLVMLPVAAFAIAGALLAATAIGDLGSMRLLIFEALKAYVLYRAIIGAGQMLASPRHARLRLIYVDDETAEYIALWVRRLAAVTIVGATFAELAQLLDWSTSLHIGLIKLVVLIDIFFLATIIVQSRRAVAERIRAKEGDRGGLAVLRNRLAAVWHYMAITVVAMFWLIWAVEQRSGLSGSLQLALASFAVIVAARLAAILALGLLARLFRVERDVAMRYSGIEARANRYYPVLRTLIGLAFLWLTAVALLQMWGFDSLAWFETGAVGRRLVSALMIVAIAVALAVAIWEGGNTAIDRYTDRLLREKQYVRSARVKTLAPLLRSTLLIVILVTLGLTVLSEIGVNIAPLLAGAGIIGIAVGFGSQKLVQDLITGLFLLLENAIQVGDWVTVSGLSGAVENLSIRTIRLRAGDGAVHIVPFSSVTSVTNFNRGIGNAAVSVNVALEEDTDRVGQVLRDIAAEMRSEARFKPMMLGDFQLWGVDKVDGAGVTIVGQIVCTDSGRWDVQREFNRRMKQRFQEFGIVIVAPNQSVLIQRGVAGQGGAVEEGARETGDGSSEHPPASNPQAAPVRPN